MEHPSEVDWPIAVRSTLMTHSYLNDPIICRLVYRDFYRKTFHPNKTAVTNSVSILLNSRSHSYTHTHTHKQIHSHIQIRILRRISLISIAYIRHTCVYMCIFKARSTKKAKNILCMCSRQIASRFTGCWLRLVDLLLLVVCLYCAILSAHIASPIKRYIEM